MIFFPKTLGASNAVLWRSKTTTTNVCTCNNSTHGIYMLWLKPLDIWVTRCLPRMYLKLALSSLQDAKKNCLSYNLFFTIIKLRRENSTMSSTKSDPMKTVPSSKNYPWYLPNIDNQIIPEVKTSRDLLTVGSKTDLSR